MLEKFKVAVEKANEVLKKLDYKGDGMVDTNAVKRIVEEISKTNIKRGEVSFSSLTDGAKDFGAMMRVEKSETENFSNKAYIVLNSDKDAIFKRFSFVHELGHIITGKYNILPENNNSYTVSTHINYKINRLPEEECKNDYMINEEIANIFALKVLMPEKFFIEKLVETDSIKETAEFFGTTTDAVLSRMHLGE